MKVAQMKIVPEPDPKHPNADPTITVMFNPTTYSISKSVKWVPTGRSHDPKANAPTLTFGGGSPRVLSLELFYDATEKPPAEQDVRIETSKIVALTYLRRDQDQLRPPICRIEWGGDKGDFPFKGTVSNLEQQFLLFSVTGQPLRATLKVTFTEFLSLEDDQHKTDPDLTTRVVRRGDTLASISAEAYRNPSAWRTIAVANRIENPFLLAPGTKLTLPKL